MFVKPCPLWHLWNAVWLAESQREATGCSGKKQEGWKLPERRTPTRAPGRPFQAPLLWFGHKLASVGDKGRAWQSLMIRRRGIPLTPTACSRNLDAGHHGSSVCTCECFLRSARGGPTIFTEGQTVPHLLLAEAGAQSRRGRADAQGCAGLSAEPHRDEGSYRAKMLTAFPRSMNNRSLTDSSSGFRPVQPQSSARNVFS